MADVEDPHTIRNKVAAGRQDPFAKDTADQAAQRKADASNRARGESKREATGENTSRITAPMSTYNTLKSRGKVIDKAVDDAS